MPKVRTMFQKVKYLEREKLAHYATKNPTPSHIAKIHINIEILVKIVYN